MAPGEVIEEKRQRRSAAISETVSRHPFITAVMLGCIVLGAVLGCIYLDGDWSLARRLLAGAVGGAGVGLLVTATRMIG